jgi:anti-sigma regulatory factor (Ser/Thr protein kinase)/serine/threonine protein phosphatase PrpC
LWSAQLGGQYASFVGFPAKDCDEIALAVTELASNLTRHAGGGYIGIAQIFCDERVGLEIQSSDKGPGIHDTIEALADGYSTVGGLGLGLGTVQRLTEDVEISRISSGGTRIVCRRWQHDSISQATPVGLQFGVATRAYSQLPENGDAYIAKEWERRALVGVVDGLGHGSFAQVASQTAVEYLEHHADLPMEDLFSGVGRACRATRGVAMALASFDLALNQLTMASVGNIEVRLLGSLERSSPAIRRGIVGLHDTRPFPTQHAWTPNSVLIMHSDGVRRDWNSDDYRNEDRRPADQVARKMLEHLGRLDDDATVVVAQAARSGA